MLESIRFSIDLMSKELNPVKLGINHLMFSVRYQIAKGLLQVKAYSTRNFYLSTTSD